MMQSIKSSDDEVDIFVYQHHEEEIDMYPVGSQSQHMLPNIKNVPILRQASVRGQGNIGG